MIASLPLSWPEPLDATLAATLLWLVVRPHPWEMDRSFRRPQQRVEAMTTPKGAKGWETVQARHNDTAGGHGLDVAPDASPDGVRAKTRRMDDGAGGEPSNAPVAGRKVGADPLGEQATDSSRAVRAGTYDGWGGEAA